MYYFIFAIFLIFILLYFFYSLFILSIYIKDIRKDRRKCSFHGDAVNDFCKWKKEQKKKGSWAKKIDAQLKEDGEE